MIKQYERPLENKPIQRLAELGDHSDTLIMQVPLSQIP
ncbi:MAG: hypothetical protein ACJAX3_000527 [Patiriisocius sp.]|jgi:hypothetical protein